MAKEAGEVSPDFNETMERQWDSYYCLRGKHEKIASWYKRVIGKYQEFRLQKREDDEENCLDVSYSLVEKWVKRKKEFLHSPVATGEINRATTEYSKQLDKCLDNPERALGLDFELVVAHSQANQVLFVENATLTTINTGLVPVIPPMDNHPSEKPIIQLPPSKKPKAEKVKTVEEIEIEDRMKRAVATMDKHGITVDPVRPNAILKDEYRHRCVICKNYRDTKFNDIPHKQLGKLVSGAKLFRFCPFADDVSLYSNYMAQCKRNKAEYSKSYHKKDK